MTDVTTHHPALLRARRARTFFRRRKWLGYVTVSILAILIGFIVVQLAYGAQKRALPLTVLDGVSVAHKTQRAIEQSLQSDYTEVPVSVTVKDKNIETTLARVGISPDTQRTTEQVTEYPIWQRFIPLTLFKNIGKDHQVLGVVDDIRFDEFSKAIVPACALVPTDAQVAVVDGALQLTPAQDGTACSRQSLQAQFDDLALTHDAMRLVVQLAVVKPAVTTAMAQKLVSSAQTLVDRSLELQLLGTLTSPDSATIASWLTFVASSDSGQTTVSFSDDAIATYLKQLQAAIYIAPGKTLVQTVDGRETGRTVGANGRGVNITDGVAKIKTQLQAGDGVVSLQTVVLAPTVSYNRTYSKTQAGLQALLDDLVKQKGDYGISVRQLGGNGWSASARGGAVYHPASTYKLFVAYAVLNRVESGQMRWDDQATNGRTVAACFDTMIINSDNVCAEWFGNKIGWKTITAMIQSVGVSSATSLYATNGFAATADDEALFLAKLQSGQLLSPEATNRLLDVMKRQVYRAGIPAGVGGVVADKVGFLNGLLHDAAIVYAPSGTYVVVIMTSGSNWAQIADAARQVHAHLQ